MHLHEPLTLPPRYASNDGSLLWQNLTSFPLSALDDHLFSVPTSTTSTWASALIVMKQILSSANRSQLSKVRGTRSCKWTGATVQRIKHHIQHTEFYSARCSATMSSSDYTERRKHSLPCSQGCIIIIIIIKNVLI